MVACAQSIMEYNGSGVVAMIGKDCVAIASDMRYGIRQQTIATDMHKVCVSLCFFRHSHVALTG